MRPRLLLTGASTSMGQFLASSLALHFDLILLGRQLAALEDLRTSLPYADSHVVLIADLSDPAQLGCLIRNHIALHGHVTDFIHGAGLTMPGPLRASTPTQVEKIFRVNALSAIEIVRVLSSNVDNNRALKHAVFISSISAHRGCPGFAIYAAAKASLIAFARTISIEIEAINTLTLSLGPLHGGGQSVWEEGVFDAGALISPNEISDYIMPFILSSCPAINGQEIVLDRGMINRLAMRK